MLDGIAQFAYEAGWVLDSLSYHTGEIPRSWEGDGILCLIQDPVFDTALRKFVLKHKSIPAVDLSLNDPSVKIARVLQDNITIGRMGAEHLIGLGCRHLGFVEYNISNAFHQDRCTGFFEAAAAAGITPIRLRPPHERPRSKKDTNWLTQYLPGNGEPFGVMAAADCLTQPVVAACEAAGLCVPEDVALVGVDNFREICELSSISITSIDNNTFKQGYEAAKLLHELMLHPRAKPPSPVIVPAGAIYVRESTNIMANRHPQVAAAIRFIADNFTRKDLTPGMVAAQVPISKRRLHDAFRRHIGRSIYQEIIHLRLQHAIQLIQTGDSKLWDIAEASGFSSAELMSRLFHRKLGHPPSHYRNPGGQAFQPDALTAQKGCPSQG